MIPFFFLLFQTFPLHSFSNICHPFSLFSSVFLFQQCDYPHCVASRHVLAHYRRCSDLHCLVCGPVRHAAMQSLNAARQQAPHQGYRKPGLLEALGHDQLQQHIQDCRQERLYQLLTVLLRKIVEHRSNRELVR